MCLEALGEKTCFSVCYLKGDFNSGIHSDSTFENTVSVIHRSPLSVVLKLRTGWHWPTWSLWPVHTQAHESVVPELRLPELRTSKRGHGALSTRALRSCLGCAVCVPRASGDPQRGSHWAQDAHGNRGLQL